MTLWLIATPIMVSVAFCAGYLLHGLLTFNRYVEGMCVGAELAKRRHLISTDTSGPGPDLFDQLVAELAEETR